jgi:hypothetical protein
LWFTGLDADAVDVVQRDGTDGTGAKPSAPIRRNERGYLAHPWVAGYQDGLRIWTARDGPSRQRRRGRPTDRARHRALLSPDWSGRVVQAVHGPEDLSWEQAVEIVGAAVGRPVTVERIPDDAIRDLLRAGGMTAGLADAVIGMSTGLREGLVPEQPRTMGSTTPTTLAAWAYDALRLQLA